MKYIRQTTKYTQKEYKQNQHIFNELKIKSALTIILGTKGEADLYYWHSAKRFPKRLMKDPEQGTEDNHWRPY
jgi:hypothetical protein